jgi:hypothetical protein
MNGKTNEMVREAKQLMMKRVKTDSREEKATSEAVYFHQYLIRVLVLKAYQSTW